MRWECNRTVQYVISALIAAAVSGLGLYLNRYWQLRQEVRAENLTHYRLLKTMGYLFIEPTEGLFDGEEATRKLQEGLLQFGTAIHELDLSASPAVLRCLVAFLREVEAFTRELEQLAQNGTKVSRGELNTLKAGMRKAYVNLFIAMRADAGRSSRKFKKEDMEYLLFIRFGQDM